jgi:hypothetical protein
MGFMDSLFGSKKKSGPDSHQSRSFGSSSHDAHSVVASHAPSHPATSHIADDRERFKVRRDLLRVVLRDTLTRAGIPSSWIELNPLAATSSSKQTGVHARFVVKNWSPLVMMHTPGLERLFIQRLLALDPLANEWVMGLSWQLQLPAEAEVAPLPKAGMWSMVPVVPGTQRVHGARPVAPEGASGDVIAGPVHIGTTGDGGRAHDAKAELDRLLAEGDAAKREAPGSYDSTQPAPLR